MRNYSAPHQGGRVLVRNQALKTLDMGEFSKEMEGIYSTSGCKSTLDESPMAYKDKNITIYKEYLNIYRLYQADNEYQS